MRVLKTLACCLLILFLASCATSETNAPVSELGPEAIPNNGVYRVVAGDTLYSIAWRYGLDYRYLADRNAIAPSFAIQAGQKIYLSGPIPKQAVLAVEPVESFTPVAATKLPVAAAPKLQPPLQPQAQPQTTHLVSPPAAVPVRPTHKMAHHLRPLPRHVKVVEVEREPTAPVRFWVWPAKGPLIGSYYGLNKGINISGKLGTPVYAAAPGKVVYSGTGLRGYGQLIIIKHNSVYLTAYAHNHSVYVTQGSWVKAGQEIAEMGRSDATRVQLYFEIRRAGKPVNPLSYLPAAHHRIA